MLTIIAAIILAVLFAIGVFAWIITLSAVGSENNVIDVLAGAKRNREYDMLVLTFAAYVFFTILAFVVINAALSAL
jgi:hypothetical protein